ncbi:MAG: metalloregulator ArsR/SmtB family transcription factor [Anaerolineae bacterium]
MPVEVAVAETETDIRTLIRFETSPLYELMLSLHALVRPSPRHREWAEAASEKVPQDLIEEYREWEGQFSNPLHLAELAVGWEDHQDVEGFLRYLQSLEESDLLFYVLGRIYPREEVADLPRQEEALEEALWARWPGERGDHQWLSAGDMEFVRDAEGNRDRLVRLLRGYWDAFFRDEWKSLRTGWEESIQEKETALAQADDAEAFLRDLLEGEEMMPMIPEGFPTEEIVLLPSHFVTRRPVRIWGYGNVTIIYDIQMTAARREALEAMSREIVRTTKALGDRSRLALLREIGRDPDEMYGRRLAKILGISQPAVSRHLAVLRDAGLIEERRSDNRIIYALRWDEVERVSEVLANYLRS